ncbi:MAG: polynucleotide adenylyltransferase PcnB [Lentisphaerae bacterium]|nr:polynucleotide adenylyltransferase PcnB [Lentisphaerota bacterium]
MITKLLPTKKPVIRKRADHPVSRKDIDPQALRVLYRLSDAGYTAYLVGGSVRDLLMGRTPKDFDVSTDAPPNAIKKLFRNCFLVGRRFRLAHIVFGSKVIETSTFRRQPRENGDTKGGDDLYQREDNDFGTPAEDAQRRDFTVNGLFYDIKTFSIIDYVGGLKDLDSKTLRSIGDPNVRFREDPVRMMRAIRFSARLGFTIERKATQAIKRHHAEISKASVPRLLEELLRLFTYSSAEPAFKQLWKFGLLDDLAPEVAVFINQSGKLKSPLWEVLRNLDATPDSQNASAGLRLATLCYPIYQAKIKEANSNATAEGTNNLELARQTLEPFVKRLRIPKATFFTATNLLEMQTRFDTLSDKPAARRDRFARHTHFPEAFILWSITAHTSPEQIAVWTEVAARVKPAIHPNEAEADASENAWRVATGAAPLEPRHGFDGRRRRRPRHAARRRPDSTRETGRKETTQTP